MIAYCSRCSNHGTVIGRRGNVELCPLACAASREVLIQWKATADVESALGLAPAGQSLDTGRRNTMSRSADDGVVSLCRAVETSQIGSASSAGLRGEAGVAGRLGGKADALCGESGAKPKKETPMDVI